MPGLLLGLLLMLAWPASSHAVEPSVTVTNHSRVVLLGDGITDRDTYRQLMRHALQDKGMDGALLFNAGVGGDTASKMVARFDRDVLVDEPTIVTISVGVRDALSDVPMDVFVESLTELLDLAKAADVQAVLVTPTPLGDKHGDERQQRVAGFAETMRSIAADRGLVVADAHAAFAKAIGEGQTVMEADAWQPNLIGQRLLAQVLLDAMGHGNAVAPDTLRHEPLPGLIREWKLWPAVEGVELNANAIRYMDAEPMTIKLPQRQGRKHWWVEFGRAMGVATDVANFTGMDRNWAQATWHEPKPREAWLNLGGSITELQLNGQTIRVNKASGWHPGKQRIPVQLKVGENRILLESGNDFFVSVTDSPDWQ